MRNELNKTVFFAPLQTNQSHVLCVHFVIKSVNFPCTKRRILIPVTRGEKGKRKNVCTCINGCEQEMSLFLMYTCTGICVCAQKSN